MSRDACDLPSLVLQMSELMKMEMNCNTTHSSRDACELPCLVMQMSELKMETTPKVNCNSSLVMNEQLEQEYLIVPSAERFALLLNSLLRTRLSKKVMVFFSSCNSVKFHSNLLKFVGVKCCSIHGKQNQQEQTSTFSDFCKSKRGILLCSDVAARDLNIPPVDWIVQYDPPSDPKEYIDRVLSQSAGGEETKRKALILLIPQEIKFLQYLEEHKVKVKEIKYMGRNLADLNPLVEKMVRSKFNMIKSAKNAYRSYILAYNLHPMKDFFNVHHLDLQAVAASFGFTNPPIVNLNPDNYTSSKSRKMTTRKVEGRTKKFSPYARHR